MIIKTFPLRAFAIISLLAVALSLLADFLASKWEREQQINDVTQRLASLRANLEFELYTNVELMRGVSAYVALNPNLSQKEFSQFVSGLLAQRNSIINIGGARDFVVRMIYPVEGNQKALGIDYRDIPAQRESVFKAIAVRKTILDGPVELVQGGVGLIARLPVFVGDETWGVISVVLDYEKVIEGAGLSKDASLNVVLKKSTDNGNTTAIFASSAGAGLVEPVSLPVKLPYGEWFIEAEPADGWTGTHFHPIFWFIATLLTLIAFYVAQLRQNNRSLHLQSFQALRRSEEKFRQFFSSHAVVMLILDEQGNIIDANEAAGKYYGYPVSELVCMRMQQIDQSDDDTVKGNIQRAFMRASSRFVRKHRLADGSVRHIEAFSTPVEIAERPFLFTLIIDITERLEYQARWELSQHVFNHSLEGIMVTDAHQHIVSVNPAFSAITGYSEQEIIGQKPSILSSGIHPPAFFKKMFQELNAEGFWRGEIWNKRKSGTVFPELLSISVVKDNDEQINYFVAVFSDITHIKQSEEKLERLAHYDSLTGLPNRVQFKLHLHHAVCRAERNKSSCALLFLDLDRFKVVNDSLGHIAGDELLIKVTERLTSRLRHSDILARMGGDEFVLLIEDYREQSELVTLASNLTQELSKPFYLSDEHEVNVGVSIGIARFPQDANNADDLLVRADAAMYRSKKTGGANFAFYTQDILVEANNRLTIAAELKRAVAENELELFLQPQFDIKHQRIIGAEALLRWNHPVKGFLTPADFIQIAEQTRSIRYVTKWLVKEVFSIVERWQSQGHDLFLSFNVSALDLSDFELVDAMNTAARQHKVDASRVELEIVESAIIENFQSARNILQSLREAGFSVAIDDFGTGYSSLAYLDKLPIDKLKIDREFTGKLNTDTQGAVVKSIIDLAANFGMSVVAEGVETQMQEAQLQQLGCTWVQGYYYSKPIPLAQFESKYLQHSRV
ncbi:EAL domain-containing protein [Aestuariibacter sp. GS-14]|uniref:bifunctional diguanylate cyclase/phosphodiesterase n=1 Tax=Aestuariibacter sp. GS-14 TaxID=2590670 RepID=UPI00112CCDB7|nr:EAL domain-containing protein [Aestuariibacter sp. GS-14]TPV55759.1 EAL domain-containing protein [Aestuariibacter sp. GS-14]